MWSERVPRATLVHEGCVFEATGHARGPLSLRAVFVCIIQQQTAKMPGNKKKNKGANKAKNASARSNAANKDDLAGLDEILRLGREEGQHNTYIHTYIISYRIIFAVGIDCMI